ncbi:hypothetical protein [Fructilactobacillus florum]|uniref:Uncharacterized protein n=1 Tax=Fructilactobacillus florum DSM 22689 = JCM 16035 TaxID=1423745 RepID=A0A0R2CP17_9LACO|nr:hypothetical protein [Fructilactobacillus florum]EKK20108.1 hypothetical protein B807_1114 [Fructilactobacillus florum 2F]KRM90028.1 hypothetical protein FC87_GL000221 [Fructilactobacillus florum DSM 22689 = JCM 16035]
MLTNLIYLKVSVWDHFTISWGISSGDFVNGIQQLPQNIILINDDFASSNSYNPHSQFPTIVGQSQIREYLIGPNGSPNKWIDYQTKDHLDSLRDDEIADLLYLAHIGWPNHQRSPFSHKLGNQFVYLGGRNGFKKIYFQRFTAFTHVLELSIKRHLRNQRNSKRIFARPLFVKDLESDLLQQLIETSFTGLILAFELARESQRQFKIPILAPKANQEKVLWNTEGQLRSQTDQLGTLTYNTLTNKWSLQLQHSQEVDLNNFKIDK